MTRLTIEHILGMRRPTNRVPLHLSNDGRLLALSIQGRQDWKAMSEEGLSRDGVSTEVADSRVVIIDTLTGQGRTVFGEQTTSWGARWSPDGEMLAAYIQRDGPACLGLWERDHDAVHLLSQVTVCPAFGFEVPRWTADSQALVLKLVPANQSAPVSPSTMDQRGVNVRVFSSRSDRHSMAEDVGLFERYRGDLAVIRTDGSVRKLADRLSFLGWEIAPDGHAVAVLRNAGADPTRQQPYWDLVVLPIEGGEPKIVAAEIEQPYGIGFAWSPDSTTLAYMTKGRGQAGHLFVVPTDGSGDSVDLAPEDMGLIQTYEAPLWSADGKHVYAQVQDGYGEFQADGTAWRSFGPADDREVLAWIHRERGHLLSSEGNLFLEAARNRRTKNLLLTRVDLSTGHRTEVTELAASLTGGLFGTDVSPNGQTAYLVLEASDHPPEVWHLSVSDPAPRRLFTPNPELDGIPFGKSRLITWRALDNQIIQGALLLPPDHHADSPRPVIVQVYGGSLDSNLLHRFDVSAVISNQLLASHGYAVFYPDLPLKGRDTFHQLPGLLLPALNQLVDAGIVDPRRIGVMGQSYGGYTVLALLAQSDRFAAAVTSAPVGVNLTSFYGILNEKGDSQWLGWAETGQGRTGGTLWEKRDAYVENSPLFYLDRVTTPLLLVSGTRMNGEAAQAGEAFSALRRLGKVAELRLYEGEGHWPGIWSSASFRDLCERVVRWFEIYLK